MKHSISTQIDINAPAGVVWKVLTDLENYSNWNPFIISAKGDIAVGSKLTNRMQPPGGKAMTFKPIVTVVEENKVFEWLGSLGLPRLFDGRHRFVLSENENKTRLVQSEEFSGILVRVLKKSLDDQTMKGFEAMNKSLKIQAELKK